MVGYCLQPKHINVYVSQNSKTWYLQNAACTNFATEKVSVTHFAQKRQK